MYMSCLIGINEAEKGAWRIYKNEENDPNINNWVKISALHLLIDINQKKFNMFHGGPVILEIGKLKERVEEFKETLGDLGKDNKFAPFIKPVSYEESKRIKELHTLKINLSNLEEKQISRQEIERLGVPYEMVRKEEEENGNDKTTTTAALDKDIEEEDCKDGVN